MKKSNAGKTIDKLYKVTDKITDKIEEMLYTPLYHLNQYIQDLEEELKDIKSYKDKYDAISYAQKMEKYTIQNNKLYSSLEYKFDEAVDYIKELEAKIQELERINCECMEI